MHLLHQQNLWDEFKALRSIAYDVRGGQSKGSVVPNSSSSAAAANNGVKKTMRNVGKKSLLDARNFSNLHYETKILPQPEHRHLYNTQLFNSELVLLAQEDIRDALESEQRELASQILILNSDIDGPQHSLLEDAVTAASAAPMAGTGGVYTAVKGASSSSSECSRMRAVTSAARNHNQFEEDEQYFLSDDDEDGDGDDSERRHISTPPRVVRKQTHQNGFNAGDESTTEASAPGSASKASKFRNRINNARDEHHFLDDF